jgi:hypothetical protein
MNEKDKEIMKNILSKALAEAEINKPASEEATTNSDAELIKMFNGLYASSREVETTYQTRIDVLTGVAPAIVFADSISGNHELFNSYMGLKNNLEINMNILKEANDKMLTFCQREALINSQIREFEKKLEELKDKITSESDAED